MAGAKYRIKHNNGSVMYVTLPSELACSLGIKALAFIALQSEGILDSVRHQCTQVFFKTRSLWEAARKPLADLCSVLKIGFKKIFGQYFVDSGVIRPFRERKKNLKQIKSTTSTKPTRQHQYPTEPPLIVETYRKPTGSPKN
jgi:hypothetical protein